MRSWGRKPTAKRERALKKSQQKKEGGEKERRWGTSLSQPRRYFKSLEERRGRAVLVASRKGEDNQYPEVRGMIMGGKEKLLQPCHG